MKLRTAVWLGALVGTGLMMTVSAQAVVKMQESSSAAPAQTSTSGKRATPAAEPGSRTAVAKPVAKTRTAQAASSQGKGEVHARQGGSHAASGGQGKTTHIARADRSVAAQEAGPHWRVADKRPMHRVSASRADLWHQPGHLAVSSGSALVVAPDGGEPIFEKNANAVLPIASITKLMTAMVVLDSLPNLQTPITISDDDVDYLRGSRSRLRVGATLARETALLLALMSSENRAAHALARHYPGGLNAFIAAMNRKAASLGMSQTHFEDPTGLSSNNVSTAHDLARMVAAAHGYPLIREFSTTAEARAEVGGREIGYHNTNQLVSSPTWEIGVSKTGYIQEAGKCLVMQARVAERQVVIVLLDSAGKQTRIGDANRIKRWLESAPLSGRTPTHV